VHLNRKLGFIATIMIKQISIVPAIQRRYSVYFPVFHSAVVPSIHPSRSFYMTSYEVDLGILFLARVLKIFTVNKSFRAVVKFAVFCPACSWNSSHGEHVGRSAKLASPFCQVQKFMVTPQ
jgi:hypothetical protein